MKASRDVNSLQLKRFPLSKQRRMDVLLDKNREGAISAKEKVALEKLVAEAEQLMVSNAKRVAEFAKNAQAEVPANAVPVTVWVVPSAVKP